MRDGDSGRVRMVDSYRNAGKSHRAARPLFALVVTLLAIAPMPTGAEVVQVNNQELQGLLGKGVPLIDVRTPPEWRETGVIEGSHLITFFDEYGRYDVRAWIEQLEQVVDPGRPFALICAVGSRTQAISQHLSDKMGYAKVYNVTDGILQWRAERGSVVVPEPPR